MFCYGSSVDPPFDNGSFNCEFPNPHSHALIDLDGDCLAGPYILPAVCSSQCTERCYTDVFLTCVDPHDSSRLTYQIWLNKKIDGFKLAWEGRFPKGAGPVSFADMGELSSLMGVVSTAITFGFLGRSRRLGRHGLSRLLLTRRVLHPCRLQSANASMCKRSPPAHRAMS
jgi:hypothetical protein